MKKEQCPICYSELEVIQCAPCYDCGYMEAEIEHFKNGIHTYNIYAVYEELELQLCNFCDVDFGSYQSDYLGFDDNRRIGYENFKFISAVKNPSLEHDKYCPECQRRLKFLNFLSALRVRIKNES